MNPTENNVKSLELWNDQRFSCALLAGTNTAQYLRNADKLNQKNNILEICFYVSDVISHETAPLDISVKVLSGLVQIYQFNIRLLCNYLKLNGKHKTSFKCQQIDEIHIQSKRLKVNNETLNWEKLYYLDIDNELLTDDQIIKYLLSNEHQTSVQNIADITLREAPLALAYNTVEDQEDDFGAVTDTEIQQLFFPFDEPCSEQLTVEEPQPLNKDRQDDLLDGANERSSRNSISNPAISIPPLEDIPSEMVPMELETIPMIHVEPEETIQPSEPSKSASHVQDQTESLLPNEPSGSVSRHLDQNGSNLPSASCKSGNVGRNTQSMVQPMITDVSVSAETNRHHKSIDQRPAKISARRMELSFTNYWKLQRKLPKDELNLCIAAYKAASLFQKPLRCFLFKSRFERNLKIGKPASMINRRLLLSKLGLDLKMNHLKQRASLQTIIPPVIEPAVNAVSSQLPQPVALLPNVELDIRPSDEDPPENPPESNNESYVPVSAMLSLLKTLWHSAPDGLPFDMVKCHIEDRRTAASVFAHLLAFSGKGIIRVVKGDNGAPQTLIKGPNWM